MDPCDLYEQLRDEMNVVLVGNENIVRFLTIALLTKGHVLLEGVPGTAKTTIAKLFAKATGLDSKRIQMTPDLLPADITGTYVYRQPTAEFELQHGPLFSNVVVVDEINRATPKTQSALLEAMQERTVTIEGDSLTLPVPFMVVATQNPIEMEGTFELPEAQRDRFQFKLTIDVPDHEGERELVDRFDAQHDLGPEDISQIVSLEEILDAREAVSSVHVDEAIKEYIVNIVRETRATPDTAYDTSLRATLTLLHGSKARAAIHGRDYVIPEDVKLLAKPTLAHRLVLDTELGMQDWTAIDVVDNALEAIVPPGKPEPDAATTADVQGDGGTADSDSFDSK